MENEANKIIKQAGLKITPGRVAILGYLINTENPVSAEAIFKQLDRKFDLVTIYRNLASFAEKGIVFQEAIDRSDRYYYAKAEHHHIVCRSCHTVACVPCTHVLKKVNNFTKVTHQFILRGLCAKCSAKQ
ncbi:MAG: Fur family transcriptional regulator [Patescibacteria group bacterium]|jgi:Fe2+ or Zn2+ uptake regulation protein